MESDPFRHHRYRLLNNTNQTRMPLEEYMERRYLDLRFNQMTGFVGAPLGLYKEHPVDR